MHDEPRITITLPLGRAMRLAELLKDVARDPNFTCGIFPATGRADYREAWAEMHNALNEASRILMKAAQEFTIGPVVGSELAAISVQD